MGEIGVPNAEATSSGAVMAPAWTPAPVVERLATDAVSSKPVEPTARMAREIETWGGGWCVREARIRVH